MEDYYPSEIARLVLGYLDDEKCTQTWHTFLEESGNLQEHRNLLKHKKRCATNVRGESLLDILKAYCALKSFFEQIICQYSWKEVLDDISYLQEQYNVHKQKSCYSTQRTGQSVVNSLKEWISKIPNTNSSRSEVNQFIYTDLPYYPSYSSLTPFKSNKENASQTDKNCQKTTDKNVQTDLLSCACLQKSEKKSAQCVDTSRERIKYPENNVIDSTSDQGRIQNKLGYLDLAKDDVTQISEHRKLCDSANKHSSPESSSFGRSSSLINPEKYGRKELGKDKSPQKKNTQVKRNLFKDPSLSNLHLSETPLQLANAKNGITKKGAEHLVEVPEVVKSIFDKPDCPDSNYSSNIDSSVAEYTDVQNQISCLAETNKYAGECTDIVPCDLSTKAAINQISKINGNGDSTTNIFALQEAPSDNNSSLLNSEHDLQIIESELDSHVSDNEMNTGDTETIIPLNTSDLHPVNNIPLEHSNTDNKFVSPENNQSSQKEEECTLKAPAQLSSLTNSCSSVENIAAVPTDTEMIDKTETSNENPGLVVFSDEMNCLNTVVQSEKQGVCNTNENTTINENQNAVKPTDDFILMNNSQFSTVISPPNQSNTVLSYTTIPEFTVPNISSDLQNNIQYKIVLNTPISWNVPIANGLSLVPPQRLSFVPSLPLSNVSNPHVIPPVSTTAVPTALLPNVPKQVAFAAPSTAVPTLPLPSTASQISSSSAGVSSHIANFETVVSDNLPDKIKSVSVVKKSKTDPKKSDSSKQKASENKNTKKESKSTTGKRPYSKRLPKRKRPSLFGSPPKSKEDPPAEIPVLSITESPCKTSASNVITKITEDFADQCKSPVLKLLMTSAKNLLKTSNKASPSHVRCLDFNSKLTTNDEILVTDGNNKVKKNNDSENVPEMLVRNEVQNNKSLTNDNAQNEQCTSKVTDKIPDSSENRNKRTINDTPSKDKRAKLQKKDNGEKRTGKKDLIPQKIKGKTKNSKNYKSPKKDSKIQKKVKFQKNDNMSIQNKRKTSPRKSKTKCDKLLISEGNSDVAIIEENKTSKRYTTCSKKEGVERINVVSVSPKKCFQLKTYGNTNKIKSHEIVEEEAIKESYKKDSESQNEKVTQETVVTETAERNKSSSKNNEVQSKKCTLDESPRKSQRIANKMNAIACKEFLVGEGKESQNKNSDHSKVNAMLDDKLSKVQQNTMSESSKVEVTSKIHLSPPKNKENEYCKSKQNKKSPKKSDKLQHKKTEDIDKNMLISLNEVNESFNLDDEATHSTPVGTPQKCIDTMRDDKDVTVLFENKKCQKATSNKNYEMLKDVSKINISEKHGMKNYMDNNEETALKNVCNAGELNDNNKDKSLKKNAEKQYSNKNNKMQNIKKRIVKSKEIPIKDVTHKSQRENSIRQNISEDSKLSENNQMPSCNVNEKLRKNIEKAANNDLEKSDNFSKMIVFDNSSELKTILTSKNSDEEIEYPVRNHINLDDDNFQLKRKIVFGDPDFKLQEVNYDEQICLTDNSKISTLEESVMHLRNIKKSKEDVISSTSVINPTKMNLQQQKYKKDFESNITCTTIINKRKMTHPKKRIKQDYLEAHDLRNSVQDTVEKVKHLASISPDAVLVLNSIKISNNSVKFSHSNLELNCSKESNSKNTSNASCSSFSSEKITSLNIDDASKNEEINIVRGNEDISKTDDSDNLNTLKVSKSVIATSRISEEVAIKSHLGFSNIEDNLNEANTLEDNVKEKLATDILQISSLKQSENEVLLEEVDGHFIADKKCDLDTSTNHCNTGNLDSVKSVSLFPNSCNKQTNVDLSNHISDDSFHSISSSSQEEVASNMSSTIYNDTVDRSLQMSKTVHCVNNDVGGTSSTSIKGNNLCDTTSNPKSIPEKRKDTASDSPMPAMKRVCRKLSSSPEEFCSSPSKNKSSKQKEKPYLKKASTKVESSQLLGKNFVGKQNLDSPVRCLQKVKKVLPKTALSKRIEKDPRIPAGVKIPYKWNNSKIITYSNEICQSTKIIRKNVNKNVVIDVNEKEECLKKKQILKQVEHKLSKDKQNLVKELPKDYKPEPCVMLTRLSAKGIPKMQCSLNSNTEENFADQDILHHAGHKEIAKAIPENNTEEIITNNPENSALSHSIPSQSIIPHFETTQDMIEADIGRSNDEGSELSIAIKNCEKELLSSQTNRLSSSPEKLPPHQSEKETSHYENDSIEQLKKTASLPGSNSTEQSENHHNKASNVQNNAQLATIRRLVEKYGAEWILQKIDILENSG